MNGYVSFENGVKGFFVGVSLDLLLLCCWHAPLAWSLLLRQSSSQRHAL